MRLIITDCQIHKPEDIPVGACLDIYLNLSDLDVHRETIPKMSRWDRYGFSRQRSRQHSSSLLTGHHIVDNQVVEVTCPLTEDLRLLLESLLARKVRVRSIRPLFPKPLNSNLHTLVIVDYGEDGCRHTLFEGSVPIYTRLTMPPFDEDEVLASISYIKTHFHLTDLVVQGPDVAEQEPYDMQFKLPSFVRTSRTAYRTTIANRAGLAAIVMLLVLGTWQSATYKNSLEHLDELEIAVVAADDQIKLMKGDLPLDKLLPQAYKDRLSDPSPIDLFRHISEVLGSDVTLSALKWENTPNEERLLLHLRVLGSDEDTDQTIDEVQDIKTHLAEALPRFSVETQSLPHGSGDQETFAGSTSHQDLKLEGDKEKAVIQMTRKKS